MTWYPHAPGQTVPDGTYAGIWTAARKTLYAAYADIYYAMTYTYAGTRQPTVGGAFDADGYSAWRAKLPGAFGQTLLDEGKLGRNQRKTLEEDDFPEHLLMYFYERCVAASRER